MDLARIKTQLAPDLRVLLEHPIYTWVNTRKRLQHFMAWHVYCVWDFMSLAKRLQGELAPCSVPWLPPKHPQLVRFIQEVVLGEECDLGPDNEVASHFDLYLRAMEEAGAETACIRSFVGALEDGRSLAAAFELAGTPKPVRSFVEQTLALASDGDCVDVAAAFYFGREDLIPEMFQRFLDAGDAREYPWFRYYLQRHIDLDGDEHGPLAERLLSELGGDSGSTDRIHSTGKAAIAQRVALWDALYAA